MHRRLIRFAVMALVSLATMSALYFAHCGITAARNTGYLKDVASQTLTRAELAIDLVVITISELMAAGHTTCQADAITAMRSAAFRGGSIQDIYLFDGSTACNGFNDVNSALLAPSAKRPHRPARNPAINLSKLGSGDIEGLGVAWTFAQRREFIAVTSTESLLFDMLPMALREHASIGLELDDGTAVAVAGPTTVTENPDASLPTFKARSTRYPLVVRIRVEPQTLATWNQAVSTPTKTVVLVIVLLFSWIVAASFVREPSLADELDRAMATGEIVPHFQPIVSLEDRRIVGCEMLARWIKPDGSQVSPARFVPIAELSGRSEKLTEVLLVQAGRMLGDLLASRADLKVAINVTPEQYLTPGFPAWLKQTALANHLVPGQLVVELTERQEIPCLDTARAVSDELAGQGISLALDDTGTGHNGLACIKKLAAASIKIDKLFIDGVAEDAHSQALVEMLIDVAGKFGMATVAEGIETEEQADALSQLGATEGQGYLFSPAVDAASFIVKCENEPAHDTRAASPVPRGSPELRVA
ncbi:MAG: EAL domain-containing protein [Hyphomicrobiaceae bacterium]